MYCVMRSASSMWIHWHMAILCEIWNKDMWSNHSHVTKLNVSRSLRHRGRLRVRIVGEGRVGEEIIDDDVVSLDILFRVLWPRLDAANFDAIFTWLTVKKLLVVAVYRHREDCGGDLLVVRSGRIPCGVTWRLWVVDKQTDWYGVIRRPGTMNRRVEVVTMWRADFQRDENGFLFVIHFGDAVVTWMWTSLWPCSLTHGILRRSLDFSEASCLSEGDSGDSWMCNTTSLVIIIGHSHQTWRLWRFAARRAPACGAELLLLSSYCYLVSHGVFKALTSEPTPIPHFRPHVTVFARL